MKKIMILIGTMVVLAACANVPKKISLDEKTKVDEKIGMCLFGSLLGGGGNIFGALLGAEGGVKLSDDCRKQLDSHSMYGRCMRQEVEKGFGVMPKLEKPDEKTGVSGKDRCLQYVEDAKAAPLSPTER